MNHFFHLPAPTVMHALAWALVHFLWQGTAIAALSAVILAFLRRASARYVLAMVALGAMLCTPVVTFFLLKDSAAVSNPQIQPAAMYLSNLHAQATLNLRRAVPASDKLVWLVELWLLGVACLSFRWAGGLMLLERQRRQFSTELSDSLLELCLTLQKRLNLQRTVRYCTCQWLDAPAVIGWFRPIVLLPITTLSGLSEEQLSSIIAHELAHIRRFDAFANVFQIFTETVLFYHPAVWWLNRRIRSEREHCCDDIAVTVCGDAVEYARALTLMEEWKNAPALAMAANHGSLPDRVFHVLKMRSASSRSRGLGFAGALICLATALAAGNMLFGITFPRMHAHAALKPQAIVPRFTMFRPSAMQASPAATPSAKPTPAITADRAPASDGSYIDGLKAVGLDNLTVDQLIALKVQDVTPEYVRQIHDEGLRPDPDDLIAMRIQGVTPNYIHELRGLGFSPSADQLVAMKIQGVTPAFVSGLREAGIQPDVDDLIAMRIQGVTPDYVKGVKQLGLQPTADNLVAMRIQGVTVNYVHEIQALGFKPTIDEFVAMRIQGVTPDYIKQLQAAGLKVSIDDAINARIQQVTPEFIQRAMKHGFRDLTLEKIIQLKQVGVLDSPAEL
jgi:beta-lactamase regulating signal transducer with metallopeptidase domain